MNQSPRKGNSFVRSPIRKPRTCSNIVIPIPIIKQSRNPKANKKSTGPNNTNLGCAVLITCSSNNIVNKIGTIIHGAITRNFKIFTSKSSYINMDDATIDTTKATISVPLIKLEYLLISKKLKLSAIKTFRFEYFVNQET